MRFKINLSMPGTGGAGFHWVAEFCSFSLIYLVLFGIFVSDFGGRSGGVSWYFLGFFSPVGALGGPKLKVPLYLCERVFIVRWFFLRCFCGWYNDVLLIMLRFCLEILKIERVIDFWRWEVRVNLSTPSIGGTGFHWVAEIAIWKAFLISFVYLLCSRTLY